MAYLSSRKAEDFCDLGDGVLAHMRWKKKGPPFSRIGRKIVYDVADLEAWLKKNRVEPGAATDEQAAA